MKTKHIIVSAISTLALIACGGMKVDLAPMANAQEEQKPEATSCECSGEAGPEGPMGPEGKQGLAGERGAQGRDGERGVPGAEGPAGAVGPEGPQGPQGLVGPVGPRGSSGNTGAQGPAGPAGAVGPRGPQGDQGPEGQQGPALSNDRIYVVDDERTSTTGQLGNFNAIARCEEGDIVLNGGCKLEGDIGPDTRLATNMPGYNGVVNTNWTCSVSKGSGGVIVVTARVTCLTP
jgi:hypothetical protein